jgi:hypothetical protein
LGKYADRRKGLENALKTEAMAMVMVMVMVM